MIERVVVIITDYIEYDSPVKIIENYSILDKYEYLLCFFKIVQKFHNLGLVHRDLKALNFLYNRNNKQGYLIDFGLSEIIYHSEEDFE